MKFPSPKYVPILKWKQGEQTALRELTSEISASIIPLIEITPDFKANRFIIKCLPLAIINTPGCV